MTYYITLFERCTQPDEKLKLERETDIKTNQINFIKINYTVLLLTD